MSDSNRKLSICRCPTHGFYSVSIEDNDGGVRLTPSKCCGRWDVVKEWRLSIEQWDEIVNTIQCEVHP